MKHKTKRLSERIRNLSLSTGAQLVGFASAEKPERMYACSLNGHKPSNLVLNTKSIVKLACGRRTHERKMTGKQYACTIDANTHPHTIYPEFF